MSSRRLKVGIFAGSVVVSSLLLTGCAAPTKPATSDAGPTPKIPATPPTAAMPVAGVPDTQPGDSAPRVIAPNADVPTTDSDRVAAQAVQRRTEQHVLSLQGAMAKRLQQNPNAQPSQVQWGDPGEFRLSSSPVDGSRDNAPATGQAVAYKPGSVDAKTGNPTMPMAVDGSSPATPNSASAGSSGKTVTSNVPVSLADASDMPNSVVTQATPSPSAASGTGSDLYSLEKRLSARVRDYPRDIAGQLEYQMLMYLMDRPVPELTPLTPMPSEDRELVSAIMDGLSNFRNTVRSDNNMLLSRKIRPLLDLADRVRTQADLTIGNVALCKAVRGFGDYDPIEPLRFAAGQEARFIAYCEVSNFSATLNEKKLWETRLSLEMVVYTENGMQVWSPSPTSETVNESYRARRHDFFLAKKVTLPANLAIGRYMLKITVVDNQVNRVSEATVPIVIGAK